ncbi:ParA family protein [Marinobacter sp. CA1]|uniref:ParA family protein n=1 Tax=Marinobacter sp. CA1 TaxID=2817656 RepID=UPI001D07D384|nr:AAA family ATPase [Marinobacter sp. CA1]MCG8516554.1 AAA family ATPase [Pseudomonadales bacterium]UDL03933.1 AAA family ATPase [Marinobacter sp. CA1]
MRILAFHNLKGGVGKTAAAVNIAYLAAQAGIPTLLWDLDPQGAASWYLGDDPDVSGEKVSRLIKGKTPVGKLIHDTPYEKLDLIPAHSSFRNLDVKLAQGEGDGALKSWLDPLSEDYGLVILDCPPSLSHLAEQVLATADQVFVPTIPTWLSANSWQQLHDFMKEKKLKPAKLHPFLSLVDRRKNLHRQALEGDVFELKRKMRAYIPYASDIERMGETRQPVPVMAPRSAAAHAYRLLWQEMRRIARL